jgi:hypothetical protein
MRQTLKDLLFGKANALVAPGGWQEAGTEAVTDQLQELPLAETIGREGGCAQ